MRGKPRAPRVIRREGGEVASLRGVALSHHRLITFFFAPPSLLITRGSRGLPLIPHIPFPVLAPRARRCVSRPPKGQSPHPSVITKYLACWFCWTQISTLAWTLLDIYLPLVEALSTFFKTC